ncbi:MAG: hypothetical protein WCO54_02280 [Bacteroidota bacterium]
MKIKFIIIAFSIICFIVITNDVNAQCPMCKASLEEARKNGTEVGNTLNSGILYLLALPYSIATVFGVIFYRNRKAKKREQAL